MTLIFPRGSSGKPPVDSISLVYGYLVNAVMPLGVPQLSVGRVLAATGPLLAIALVIPIAAAFVVVVRRGTSSERLTVCALAIGSIVVYVASVTTNPDHFYDYAQMSPAELVHAWLTRYGVVPSMMLAAIVALGLGVAVATRRPGSRWWQDRRSVSFAAVSALLAISLASQFTPEFTRRSEGPAWQPQLAAASERCETLPPAATVSLRETIGWHVTMPCRLHAIPSRPGAISRLGW